MTEAVIFAAALLTLACAILAALFVIMRNAPSQPQRQSYRRLAPGAARQHRTLLSGLMSPRGTAAFFRVSRSQFSEYSARTFRSAASRLNIVGGAAYCWHFG